MYLCTLLSLNKRDDQSKVTLSLSSGMPADTANHFLWATSRCESRVRPVRHRRNAAGKRNVAHFLLIPLLCTTERKAVFARFSHFSILRHGFGTRWMAITYVRYQLGSYLAFVRHALPPRSYLFRRQFYFSRVKNAVKNFCEAPRTAEMNILGLLRMRQTFGNERLYLKSKRK